MMKTSLILLGFFLAASDAFVVQQNPLQRCNQQQTVCFASDRRTVFVEAASLFTTVAAVAISTPAAYGVDDLDMPAVEEKSAEDAMAERLRRKRELQKKAAQPATFEESFKKEREKQKEQGSLSKEQRRDRMCEELGRGC